MRTRIILDDLTDVSELEHWMKTVARDDGLDVSDYTDAAIVKEAVAILERYNHGTLSEGKDSEDARTRLEWRRERAKLQRFIARWDRRSSV